MPSHFRLTPLQFDVLWTEMAFGETPYPLVLTGHGEDQDDRRRLRRQALQELTTAGAVRDRALDEDLEAMLTTLAGVHTGWVQAVCLIDQHHDSPARVLAAHTGQSRRAVLAVQRPGPSAHTGGDLHLSMISRDSMIRDLVSTLPPHPRGARQRVSAPMVDLLPRVREREDLPDSWLRNETSVRPGHRGRAVAEVRELTSEPFLRTGQITLGLRDQVGRVRRTPALAFMDKPDGRYVVNRLTDPTGAEWLSVTPVDAAGIAAAAHTLLAAR